MAKTFFKDASVYILDEPNASLDPVAENEIFKNFISFSKDKIGIFICHRLVVAKNATKIIVLDKGEIVGVGNHKELIKNCNIYKELYKIEKYNYKGDICDE